jgi:hypothetical protein
VTLSPTSSRGSGGAAAGALTQLYSLALGADGTFDQAGISGAYNDLLLSLVIRSAAAGTSDNPGIRFNNDSGANYYGEYAQSSAATTTGVERGAATGLLLGKVPAASGLASSFASMQVWISGYASTAFLKVGTFVIYDQESNVSGGRNAVAGGFQWASTLAISRVTVASGTFGNLVAGSTLRIYGIT